MGKSKSGSSGSVRRIDTKYFSAAISELDSAIRAFDAALNHVAQQTAKLQNCWDGKGADKFDSAYKRLKKEFDDQGETLAAIRDDLKTILETYEAWDASAKEDLAGES